MYKLLTIMIFSIWGGVAFGQQTHPVSTHTQEVLFKRAQRFNTAAWVLAGGGSVLITTGMFIGHSEFGDAIGGFPRANPSNNDNTGIVLLYAGLVMIGGSIPFFIMAGKNKQKALHMQSSFKLEESWQNSGLTLRRKYYPALSLYIPINTK